MEQTTAPANQPATISQPPVIPSIPIQSPPKTSSKKLFLLVLLIVFLCIASFGLAFFIAKSQVKTPIASPVPITQASPTPPDETANWKTFTSPNNSYSFEYPSNWSLRTVEYENTVYMANEKKSVGMVFSDHQYPYGFGPEYNPDKKSIDVLVGEQTIPTTEIVASNSAYVDLAVKSPKEIHVIFGTGYPVASVTDDNASLTDYLSSKATIFKVLSTFKFLDNKSNINMPGTEATLSGTIRKTSSRPAPDIPYDYEVILDEPLTGITSGIGVGQTLSTIVIQAETGINLENFVNKHVSFIATLEWGYSESRVLIIKKLLN